MKNMKAKPPDSSLQSMADALGHEDYTEPYGAEATEDKRYTLPADYAMGLTVSTDYIRTNRRIPVQADPASTNKQANFDEGLVLRQPL